MNWIVVITTGIRIQEKNDNMRRTTLLLSVILAVGMMGLTLARSLPPPSTECIMTNRNSSHEKSGVPAGLYLIRIEGIQQNAIKLIKE